MVRAQSVKTTNAHREAATRGGGNRVNRVACATVSPSAATGTQATTNACRPRVFAWPMIWAAGQHVGRQVLHGCVGWPVRLGGVVRSLDHADLLHFLELGKLARLLLACPSIAPILAPGRACLELLTSHPGILRRRSLAGILTARKKAGN